MSDTGTDLPGTLAALAAALAVVDGIADAILEDTGTTLPAQIEHVTGEDIVPYLELILEDTGTTLPAQIAALGGEAIVPYLEQILEDTGTTLPAEHAAISDTLAEILEDTDATLPALITSTIVVAVDPPLDGSKINAYIGATLRVTFTNLPVSDTRTDLIFTAKKNLDEADSTALVQILESNPAGDSDGLIYYNGRSAGTRQDQARMVSDATEDSVVLTIDDDLTAVLYKTRVQYDIKQFYADGSSTVMTKGIFETRATPTKVIAPEEL